jgi:hypothetical protein
MSPRRIACEQPGMLEVLAGIALHAKPLHRSRERRLTLAVNDTICSRRSRSNPKAIAAGAASVA